MGYSKWRKILTILMIINILFVLFAKFNKVFGAFYSAEYKGVTFEFNDTFNQNNPYYCLFVSNNKLSGSYYATLVRSNDIITINNTKDKDHIYFYNKKNTGITSYFGDINSLSRDLTNNSFTNMPIPSVGSSDSLLKQDVSWSCIFTNHDLYNTDGSLYKSSDAHTSPFFSTPTEDIQKLSFNNLFIEPGDWDTSIPLYLHCLEITNIIDNGNNTNTYYYNDNIFLLDNKSKYYEQFFDTENYYFSVPKYNFAFNADTSYLLVLNDTVNSYNNSIGLIDKDIEKNIFQSVLIDTSGKITATDTINDNISNIKDEMSDNTVSSETETELENSLHFDNKNEELKNINNNFFSRLTTMISNLVGYDLGEDTVINIPMPNSDKTITLHSNILYKNVSGALRVIINAFWFYLFSFYLYKFVNKLYIAISTGNILDTFSSEGEAITNNML